MTYVGIGLAAEAKRTGLAVLGGAGEVCFIEQVVVGADDDRIINAVVLADRAGVDVPLGWPDGFVALVSAHAVCTLVTPVSTGRDWRRNLAMRATDLLVHRRTGITSLSVATERIAHAAFRWAGIEARLRDLGIGVSRDGSGAVCEVYPAAALKVWSMPHRRYKGSDNSSQPSYPVRSIPACASRFQQRCKSLRCGEGGSGSPRRRPVADSRLVTYSAKSSVGVGLRKPRVTKARYPRPTSIQARPMRIVLGDRLVHSHRVRQKPIPGRTM